MAHNRGVAVFFLCKWAEVFRMDFWRILWKSLELVVQKKEEKVRTFPAAQTSGVILAASVQLTVLPFKSEKPVISLHVTFG